MIHNIKDTVPGPLSLTECQVLGEIATATHATRVLEVGHYLGLSTSVLLSSLPERCELVTIDHHRGDKWCGHTSVDDFMANIKPYVGDRRFTNITADMREALADLSGTFGFVFYDADHTAEAVAEFWEFGAHLLEDRCTLVFDDADWAEQSTLRDIAERDGFRVITDRPFLRTDGDKHDPQTYTLEVMQRP